MQQSSGEKDIRPNPLWRDTQVVEGSGLLNRQAGDGAWVRIPVSPPIREIPSAVGSTPSG